MSKEWYCNKRLEIATAFIAAYYANPESDLRDPMEHFLEKAEELLSANLDRGYPEDAEDVQIEHNV